MALSVLGLTGFFMSLLVHLATYFGVDPSRHAPWCGCCIWASLWSPPRRSSSGGGDDFWDGVFATRPRRAGYVVGAFFAYGNVNLALFFLLSAGGVPGVRDGKYVLHEHGRVSREPSRDEYELQKAYVLRGFSGHGMVFYLVPALCIW